MTEFLIGREPIQIVEIQQPLCTNTFGIAPCTASAASGLECYNTRATCQDTDNYTLGTALSLFFARGDVAARGVSGAPYIIPALVSVSTSPTKINLSAANPDAQGLGNRALCKIRLQDHPHTDRKVDPYLSTRSFDPMDRGSFWTKWLVRNKYRQNVVIKVYEGYDGQALSAMNVRTYFLQTITGPGDSGAVNIQGKDILAKIEDRKAQAPVVSPGDLYVDIDSSVTSFVVANAITSEYSATGTLRINDEIMTYTGVSTDTNGIEFTGVTRGTDNTTAAAHSSEDQVQECLRVTSTRVDSVLNTLLTTYGGVAVSYIDTSGWTAEADLHLNSYNLTALITEPTSVSKLVSEIQAQSLCYVWWDERTALVNLKAIRGVDSLPPLVTSETNIIAGSFSLSEMPRQRVSQVWVYYNQRDFTKSETDPASYANAYVAANLESETDELYGEPSIRKIFARFLPTDALALSSSSKIITRYVDTPRQCKFRMDAKDRSYWTGDIVRISHDLDVDQFGARNIAQWIITSAEEVVPGEIVEYTAEDATLYGRISVIVSNATGDYVGDGTDAFDGAWITDANGNYSNGDAGARIN